MDDIPTSLMVAVITLLVIILYLLFALGNAQRVSKKRHEQLDHLRMMLSEDERWFSRDEVAKQFVDRYLSAAKPDWRLRAHLSSSTFRSQLEKLYRKGWHRYDHSNGVQVHERTRMTHTPL